MKLAIAVLDANVLYPAPLRDFLLNLAEQNCYNPKWTNEIHQEWIKNLLLNRKDLKLKQLTRTVNLMNGAFPFSEVINFTSIIPKLELPDQNDRHILAAGIKSKADYIVTNNLKDFPNSYLKQFDIQSISPDNFVMKLFNENSRKVNEALENQLNSLKNPPMTKSQLKIKLMKNGLTKTMKIIE